ncbi:MAG: hypothetical protein JXA54_14930 [Candidatus Heimdallarchaeota archaeon]|nr:hypothetical protein [Candidatus Heimdallarchaeota archaeon]
MIKINTKVVKVVITLLTLLIAGGASLTIKEGFGDPDTGTGSGSDDTGLV